MKKKYCFITALCHKKKFIPILQLLRLIAFPFIIFFTSENVFAQPCTLTCPANVTVNNSPGQCGAVVNFPATIVTGSCGTVTTTPASGSFFPIGTTVVTSQTSVSPSLYSQTGVQIGATASQNFQPSANANDCNAADDFTVPGGQIWTVSQVNVGGIYSFSPGPASLNVIFYNNSGNLPGSVITTFNNVTTFTNGPNFNITLPSSVVLNPGTYWVSVQVNMDNPPDGQWLWSNYGSSNSGSEFAWQNPGGGLGTSCTSFGSGFTGCGIGGGGHNLVFEIIGSAAPSPSLYSQTGVSIGATASQNFQPSANANDCNAADDFTVPGGQIWTVSQVNVGGIYSFSPGPASLNVIFYNNSGNLPGSVITTFNNVTTFTNGPNFHITLPSSVVLNPGTYWVSVQVNMDNPPDGQWLWSNYGNSNSGSEFAWQNPGGGLGTSCTSFGSGYTGCGIGGGGHNLIFEIIGSTSGGGSSICTFTVTVNDTQTPSITCPAPVTVSCASAVPPVNIASVAASDNCPGVVITHIGDVISVQTCVNRYTLTRTYRATDAAGNFTNCTQIITVNDVTPPTLTCPAPITVSCASAVPAPNIAAVTGVGDNCGGVVTVTFISDVISNQTCANRYTITRTYRATDVCGNFAECTQIITVNDITAPTLTCPAPVTVSCASAVPAPNIAAVTGVSDNCGGVVTVTFISDVISNQTCANRYTITRTYRATDVCGNFAECTQIITVNDVTAPVIICPTNITVTTPVGSCTVVVNFTPTATDNCGGAITIVSSPASGSAFPIGTTTVTSTATDACGNTATCTFTVTVNDGQLPAITTQPANRTVCAGTNATFNVVATKAVSYLWQQWNGSAWVNIAGATASLFTVSNTTVSINTNTFRVIVTGLCTVIISNAATLYVNPLPSVLLSATSPPYLLPNQTTMLNAATSPSGGSFIWFFNGTPLPGVSGASLGPLNVNDIGTYHVVYIDLNGCVSISANLNVNGAVSEVLWVYPNPNYGQFQVRFYNKPNEPVTVNVFDALGRKIYHKSMITGSTTYTKIVIDLKNKPNGVYVVELIDGIGNRRGAKQIIIQTK